MHIACIGWGSLIWDPRDLPIAGGWNNYGPCLPIEFTRISSDGRVTLIVDPESCEVQTLWALMTVDDLPRAVTALQQREGALRRESIHLVDQQSRITDKISGLIQTWTIHMGLDAAIWTGLSYSRTTHNQRPSVDYVIDHLKNLQGDNALRAEEYVRRTPVQIKTIYRQAIEDTLGWTPIK